MANLRYQLPKAGAALYWTDRTRKTTAWCALKPGTELDKTVTRDATACGYTVMLRIGCQKRMPTCPECIKALTGVRS